MTVTLLKSFFPNRSCALWALAEYLFPRASITRSGIGSTGDGIGSVKPSAGLVYESKIRQPIPESSCSIASLFPNS